MDPPYEYGTYDRATNEILGKDNATIVIKSPGATTQGGHDGASVKGGAAIFIAVIYHPNASSIKDAFNFPYIKNPTYLTIDDRESYLAQDGVRTYYTFNKPYSFSIEHSMDSTMSDQEVSYKEIHDNLARSFRF